MRDIYREKQSERKREAQSFTHLIEAEIHLVEDCPRPKTSREKLYEAYKALNNRSELL